MKKVFLLVLSLMGIAKGADLLVLSLYRTIQAAINATTRGVALKVKSSLSLFSSVAFDY